MLANGCCCNFQRWRKRDERRFWNGSRGFLPWIPGRPYDDAHVQPCAVHILDLQDAAFRHFLGGALAHNVGVAICRTGEHPANVYPCDGLLETLLRRMPELQQGLRGHQGLHVTDRLDLSTLARSHGKARLQHGR